MAQLLESYFAAGLFLVGFLALLMLHRTDTAQPIGAWWLGQSMPNQKQVTIYTDGSCLNNPGPGGYGAVLLFEPHRREISGGFQLTTNNRMEMMAVIAALEALKEPCRIILYSDSQYVVNAMTRGWAQRWQANDWKRNKKEKAVNPDLWERLLQVAETHEVDFRWLRGHSGIVENERCDRLAFAAATQSGLPEDLGYQRNQ